jgi:pyruvate/2-oxoglutarate dehydrogenase complex dihydrolipoamide dehydrogenase (E3) component
MGGRAHAPPIEGFGMEGTFLLRDGRILPCDLFLAAVGMTPNVELAKAAGIEVERGIVVDSDATPFLSALRAGDWGALRQLAQD